MSVMFCDTNCELWYTRAEELGLKVIGMPYLIDNVIKDYDLGKNTDFKEFYDKIRKGSMPLTQALNPQNYIDYFEPYLSAGQDILYVHFSHNLSGTFEFMDSAIKELQIKYPKRTIKTVDTLSISIGATGLLYEAAKLHNSGATDDEVIEFVENNRSRYRAYFVVDDLNHLKRGGRISNVQALMGTMLAVKPILTLNVEGKIESIAKAKGKKKALLDLFERLKTEGENIADHPIIVTHADVLSEAEFLVEKVKEFAGEGVEVWLQPVGPTIGTHCGPGTIGISFHAKSR
ncbi:MAG: DegV family protein [Spirochaetales bacterium]